MTRLILAIPLLAALAVSGCTRPDKARRILKEQGFTDIQITGYKFFACDEKDTFSTGFIATSPTTGARVEGVVCSGLLKGYTVRFF